MIWLRRVTALAAFLVFCVSPCAALDPQKAPTQYVLDTWGVNDGLPQATIEAIAQSRDGYIWIGTQEGLVRFDGVRFTIFDRRDTDVMKSQYIRALLADHKQGLWIGTRDGLLYFLKGKFTRFETRDGLCDNNVVTLHQSAGGKLWIGTGGGLSEYDGKKFKCTTTKEGLSSNVVQALTEDPGGQLWVGTAQGLNSIRNGKITKFNEEHGLKSSQILSLHSDNEGTLWIGTRHGGLHRHQNGMFESMHSDISDNTVWDIEQDHDNALWLATDHGIDRVANGNVSTLTTAEGLPHDGVLSLLEDREGNLWIGTYDGLTSLKDGLFASYSKAEGLSDDSAQGILEDRDGAVWIATYGGGLNRFKDGKFSSYRKQDGLLSDGLFSLYQDAAGILWIGTESGLNCIKNGEIVECKEGSKLAGVEVHAINGSRQGDLWIGTTGNGLFRLVNGVWKTYSSEDGLKGDAINGVYEDKNGNIWVATSAGLNLLQGERFVCYDTTAGLPNQYVTALHQDGQGMLWIATAGGLARYHKGKFTGYTTRDGLHNDYLHQILEDDAGNLWISSNSGVFQVSKNELNDFADGTIRSIHSTGYGTDDGMKSRDCWGGFQPAGYKIRDGRMWFPTTKGVAVVDPKKKNRTSEASPVITIEEVLLDNKLFTNFVEPGTGISFPAGIKNLEIHYTGFQFKAPDRLDFQYRLEPFDDSWVEAGSRRIAHYTNLPPGDYTFHVKARNRSGAWSPEEALRIHMSPRFYQTGWFAFLVVLLMAASLLAAHRIRVKGLKKQQENLENIVSIRTNELREANRSLENAQQKIARLMESTPQALENFPAWAKALGDEISTAAGAGKIAIWMLDQGNLVPLHEGAALTPPSMEQLRDSFAVFAGADHQIYAPIRGMGGELFGTLAIAGHKSAPGEEHKRLFAAFARQLGGALELRKMREQLTQVQTQQAAALSRLKETGAAAFQICPICRRCYDDSTTECKADGAPLDTPWLLPYRFLERYRIEQLLGEGGMGIVFRAYDESLDRIVAVKVLKEFSGDPLLRVRFEREAHVIAAIRHPGIVSIHDMGETPGGTAFLVMEYLHGQDLSRILKEQGPAAPAEAAEVLQQVGEALHAAHESGVIHRDLKPANIFLLSHHPKFHVKLVDFGLAKNVTDSSGLTQSGIIVGSPSYMSPEQIRQQPLDRRSDLFSLASVAYELLTGATPFDAPSVSETLTRILREDPSPLWMKLPTAGQDLEHAFSEAFEKDHDLRPDNVLDWIGRVVPLLRNTHPIWPGWNHHSSQQEPGL